MHPNIDRDELRYLSKRARRAAYKNRLGRANAYDTTVNYMANYGGVMAQRAPSPWFLSAVPWNSILDGSTPGMVFYDDFQSWGNNPALTLTSVVNVPPNWQAFATSTGTIPHVKTVNSVQTPGGALAFTMDSTGGHSASIAQPTCNYAMTGLTSTTGPLGKLAWEACIAVSTVAANSIGFFAGLAVTDAITLATAVPFTSGTGLAIANTSTTAAYVGFNLPSNGAGQMKTVYADASVTAFTAVGATDPALMTANTFTRIGMLYDPTQNGTSSTSPGTCAIQFFQDNVMLPTGITNATLVALTNLDSLNLGSLFSFVAGSAAATPIGFLKWVRCGQVFLN